MHEGSCVLSEVNNLEPVVDSQSAVGTESVFIEQAGVSLPGVLKTAFIRNLLFEVQCGLAKRKAN